MAHLRITQKEAREGFYKIYRINNYPNIASELKNIIDVYFYNYTKQNGWNCDLFPLSGSIALTIGYKCFGKQNNRIYELAKEFDKTLMKISQSSIYGIERTEAKEKSTIEFIAKVLEVANE